jgi:hypothetical protein
LVCHSDPIRDNSVLVVLTCLSESDSELLSSCASYNTRITIRVAVLIVSILRHRGYGRGRASVIWCHSSPPFPFPWFLSFSFIIVVDDLLGDYTVDTYVHPWFLGTVGSTYILLSPLLWHTDFRLAARSSTRATKNLHNVFASMPYSQVGRGTP